MKKIKNLSQSLNLKIIVVNGAHSSKHFLSILLFAHLKNVNPIVIKKISFHVRIQIEYISV